MWFILGSLLGSNSAFADNPGRPLRPTTHPGDSALTEGPVENFQRLYIDPSTISSQLTPIKKRKGETLESLPIKNKTTAWVDISINDIKIGRIGPLTTGLIHDVIPGKYLITLEVEKTQFAYTMTVPSTIIGDPLTPGNMRAIVAESPEYQKSGFEITMPPAGKLVSYQFPVDPNLALEGEEEVLEDGEIKLEISTDEIEKTAPNTPETVE